MDRIIAYPGQNPSSVLINQNERMKRLGLGTWLRDALGPVASAGAFTNLTCVPGTGLNVVVQPAVSNTLGAVYQTTAEDSLQVPQGYSPNIAADTTPVVLQGLQTGASAPVGPMTAPGTVGQSVYYLLEAQISTVDTTPESVLFVSSSGTRTFQTVNTERQDIAVYQLKAGAPGTAPTVPSVDSGWVAVATILIPHGATQVTTPMIAMLPAFAGFNTGAGILQSRATVAVTTVALTSGSVSNLSVSMAKTYTLLNITTDNPARVEVYKNTNERAADSGRPIGTPANPGVGLIAEVVTTSGALSIDLSPQPIGSDTDSPVTSLIPIAVTNTGTGTTAIHVAFTFLPME